MAKKVLQVIEGVHANDQAEALFRFRGRGECGHIALCDGRGRSFEGRGRVTDVRARVWFSGWRP